MRAVPHQLSKNGLSSLISSLRGKLTTCKISERGEDVARVRQINGVAHFSFKPSLVNMLV